MGKMHVTVFKSSGLEFESLSNHTAVIFVDRSTRNLIDESDYH